jgi:hypothetical protein
MNIGIILLGIWLIIFNVALIVPALNTPPMHILWAVLGIVAGLLLLVGK